MRRLLNTRIPFPRLLGIVALGAVGWWLLSSSGLVQAQFSSSEWPKTDFDNTLVDLDEIMSGGPPKDGIPAIDKPQFISPEEASEWLDPKEPVIAVSMAGQARAYPLQILMYHEIVNDAMGDVPYSVTFCPLCNACLVYERRVEGRVLDFGTTGKLRKSDLVMYDRQTESWWQQLSGQAIIGELAGVKLQLLPANIVAFEDFKSAYPAGEVLSRETGFFRPYGNNPYRGYDSISDQPFLFRDPVDPRLPPMERVLNITVGDTHKLYPFSVFENEPVINDEVGGLPVIVFSRDGTLSVLDDASIKSSRTVPSATAYERTLEGRQLTFEAREGAIVDKETGSQWNLFGTAVAGPLDGQQLKPAQTGLHFAFAWLAFNPDSEIYASSSN